MFTSQNKMGEKVQFALANYKKHYIVSDFEHSNCTQITLFESMLQKIPGPKPNPTP